MADDNVRSTLGSVTNTEVVGGASRPWTDMYHSMLRGTWPQLTALAFTSYVFTAAIFALLFRFEPGCIEGVEPHDMWGYLWFSIHTLSTIGFGHINPVTGYANVIVTIEAFVGLAGTAVVTALMFAKFARPTARVVFARHLVLRCGPEGNLLQLRIANQRNNQILDARLHLSAMVNEVGPEGIPRQRLVDLELERTYLPMLALTWVGSHRIDARSPLYGLPVRDYRERVVFFLATLSGTDDTYLQTVHARRIFGPDDIMPGHHFADAVERTDKGKLRLHLDRLEELVPDGVEVL